MDTEDSATREGGPHGLRVGEDALPALAADAAERATQYRLTLADLDYLAVTLPEFPGEQLDEDLDIPLVSTALSRAATYAADNPEAPESAAALLLVAMARRQDPPIDLLAPMNPGQLRLGNLDLQLVLATLLPLMGGVNAAQPGIINTLSKGRNEPQFAVREAALLPVAGADAICSGFARDLDDLAPFLGGFLRHYGLAAPVSDGLKKFAEFVALQNSTPEQAEKAGKAFGHLMNVLGIVARLQALVMLYQHAEVKVQKAEPSQLDLVHKPNETEVTPTLRFRATAGVPDDQWTEADVRSSLMVRLTDCARATGLPVPMTKGELGAQAGSWRVEWRLSGGSPEHALFARGQEYDSATGQLENHMKAVNDHTSEDVIGVEPTEEKTTDHPGDELVSAVSVDASVETDQPPDIRTLFRALDAGRKAGSGNPFDDLSPGTVADVLGVGLGLARSIVDLMAGLIQNLKTLKASHTFEVSYHVPRQGNWRGNAREVYSHVGSWTGGGVPGSMKSGRSAAYVISSQTTSPGKWELQFRQSANEVYDYHRSAHAHTDDGRCTGDDDTTNDDHATAQDQGNVDGGITVQPDGSYTLFVGQLATTLRGKSVETLDQTSGGEGCVVFGKGTPNNHEVKSNDLVMDGSLMGIVASGQLSAQQKTISGTVTDGEHVYVYKFTYDGDRVIPTR